MRLPRYESYQQPDDDWLGELPEHWNVRRTKTMFTLQKTKVGKASADYTLLSLTLGGVIVRDMAEGGKLPAEFDAYQIVEPDDLVFCLFDIDETPRTIGIAHNYGMITGAYSVYRALPSCVPEYACYYFLHLDSFKGLRPFYTGLRKVVRADTFSKVTMPAPPVDEQKQIAAFLDYETAKIDALIEKQQQLIALLGEKRQAVISHAVTKGLNPDAPMRDSGIEWLGEVPEHWKVGPLKRFWPVIDCKHVTVPFLDEGFPVASVMEVRTFELDLSRVLRTDKANYELLKSGGREPKKGDVIYCRNTANTGTSAYVGTDEPICIGQDVVLIKSREQNGRYLNYILHGPEMEGQLNQYMVGSTFQRINVADIRELIVTCPPRPEQDKLVEHLDEKASQFDGLMDNAYEMVELLQERRTALISAAVTGKIDVRGWKPPSSARMPETEMEVA